MQYRIILILSFLAQAAYAETPEAGIWSKIEFELVNSKVYSDPFAGTRLVVELKRPDKSVLRISGFYDGENKWKFRVMPDMTGKWTYSAWFTDKPGRKHKGSFNCIQSDLPGLISADETNPVWFGFRGGKHILVRSFHVGDRFFASNFNDNDRNEFLDWLTDNKYNTISVASHLLNRNAPARGKGWNTPDLWNKEKHQPDPAAFSQMEKILDDLASRKIIVFPFAGFFGQQSDYPTDSLDQSLYIEYAIARIGAYWNVLYNVAGPEPLYKNVKQFTKDQVDRLGHMIAKRNSYNHLLTVHNEKNHNPFTDAPWATFQCLQGPTTLDTDTLYQGLMSRRNPGQPLLAQEVLWYGNIYQQKYSDNQLRKNAFTIMMAGGSLNFADNSGTSSTGFTGTLNLAERHQDKHEIIKKVWDFFESINFYELTPSQNLCDNGYGMASENQKYLIYLPSGGSVKVNHGAGNYRGTWIKGSDTEKRISIGLVSGNVFEAPSGEDWILLLQNENGVASKSFDKMPFMAGFGSYPDITSDKDGNLHCVYVRDNRMYYRKFNPVSGISDPEVFTSITFSQSRPDRSDPEIIIDKTGRIHVFAGDQYAFLNNMAWINVRPGVTRDTDMAVDQEGNTFINTRGGFSGGKIGVKFKKSDDQNFRQTLTDPDIGTVNATNWIGAGDHNYGSISAGVNGDIHLVYRQGSPEYVSYRRSADKGKTWQGTGVYGVKEWQGEGADITVAPSGNVMIISHDGFLYFCKSDSLEFRKISRLVSCESRDLPSISAGAGDKACVTSFGGKYNVYIKGQAGSERQISSLTGKPIGFADNCFAGDDTWAIYEEGDEVHKEELEGTSVIFLRRLEF